MDCDSCNAIQYANCQRITNGGEEGNAADVEAEDDANEIGRGRRPLFGDILSRQRQQQQQQQQQQPTSLVQSLLSNSVRLDFEQMVSVKMSLTFEEKVKNPPQSLLLFFLRFHHPM